MAQTSVPLDVLQDVIARAIAERPEQRSRIERAAKLIATDRVYHLAFSMWLVASETDPNIEYVLDRTGCPCDDAKRHPELTCKHQWSAKILLDAQERARQIADCQPATAAVVETPRDLLARLIEERAHCGRIAATEGRRAIDDERCNALDEQIAKIRANLTPVTFRETVAA
jgi:hypothetical protein